MLEEKAVKIRLVFLDVDGVLTDGSINMNDRGEEIKSFDIKDGLGLRMLISAGIEPVIISGRKSDAISHRAGDLGIKEVHMGVVDKKGRCKQIIETKGLGRQSVCCVGDDLPDLAMFSEAGLNIAVADAAHEVREAADLVTKHKGGHGAVREVCEWLLKCQEKWPEMLSDFRGK
jgi:3-deoxy-D-manno-octulosonate 8-phosphate phosphatase (KDO 8-P phosphatase)